MTAAAGDGRRRRGDQRRRELVDASLRVLLRDGLAGLTHRAVTEEAGVPLASASYHFNGIDDLALAALVRANDLLLDQLEAIDDDRSVTALADVLVGHLADRGALSAYYELYLLAARQPGLREHTTRWLTLLTDRYAPDLQGAALAGLQAAIDGLCLHAMIGSAPATAPDLELALRAIWPRGV